MNSNQAHILIAEDSTDVEEMYAYYLTEKGIELLRRTTVGKPLRRHLRLRRTSSCWIFSSRKLMAGRYCTVSNQTREPPTSRY